jgi:hypothetical protein
LLASGLIIAGLQQVGLSLFTAQGPPAQRLLTAVGYVVIAVAVFDVAKYILEEEVIRERELRHVGEVRRSLTRFTSTVLIAVFLEGVVLTFKVADEDVSLTVYPALLIFAGAGMLVGLGLFQRIAVNVEQAAHDSDAKDAEGESGR